jgi:hypothetical protein
MRMAGFTSSEAQSISGLNRPRNLYEVGSRAKDQPWQERRALGLRESTMILEGHQELARRRATGTCRPKSLRQAEHQDDDAGEPRPTTWMCGHTPRMCWTSC